MSYSLVNSIGKQWVRTMALAFAKQTIGRIRSKMITIPIPNGDLTLDGQLLTAEAIQEQENLRMELKEWMESMIYEQLVQKQMQEAENLKRILQNIPLRNFCRLKFVYIIKYLLYNTLIWQI